MATNLKFSADQYRSIMSVFNMLKDPCRDLTIQNGRIHQLSGSKTLLYDIDLTKFFNTQSLYIANLKQQHVLLNMFALSNNEVMLKIDTTKYTWMDKKSKIECTIPEPGNLQPSWLDPTKDRSINTKSLGTKIFETVMDRTVLDRIFQSSKALEANTITVSVKDDTAKFVIIPGDMLASTKLEVHEVNDLNDESFSLDSQYDISSFIMKTEELKLSLHKNAVLSEGLTLKFEAVVDGVNVVLWSATKFVSTK